MDLQLFRPFSNHFASDWDGFFEPTFFGLLAAEPSAAFAARPRRHHPQLLEHRDALAPWDSFRRSMFQDSSLIDPRRMNSISSFPRVEEDENQYTWKVDVPGTQRQDISIQVTDDNVLRVHGTHKEYATMPHTSNAAAAADKKEDLKKDEDNDAKMNEDDNKAETKVVSQRSFHYEWTLGDNVVSDELKADLRDGVLTLTAPKKEVRQPTARNIPISIMEE